MSGSPIAFSGLTHYYGETKALDSVSFEVPRGCIFALLGRNGAGKTTALRCLLGFQRPTRGRSFLLGHESLKMPPALRARIGYVAEGQRLVRWMKVRQLVAFQRSSFPNFDEELCRSFLRRLGLPEKRRVFQLSRGMQAQLALALALAPRPELVILDDPAMGLDAAVRREFLEVMIDLIEEEGRTLLFTSHILTDVERVADRVAILDGGVLRLNAPLDVVKERVRRYRALFEAEAPAPPRLPRLVRARRRRNELVLTVVAGGGDGDGAGEGVGTGDGAGESKGDDAVREACSQLGAREIVREPMTLEDLFIDYTAPREVES